MIRINILSLCLALLILGSVFSCDSGDSGSDSSTTADIDGLLEECNAIYTKYSICTWNCDFGGLCIEGCVNAWYGDFLECFEQFDAETSCLKDCLEAVDGCYDQCGPLEHDKRYQCYRDLTDCEAQCPPPIAEDVPLDEYEDRFGDEES